MLDISNEKKKNTVLKVGLLRCLPCSRLNFIFIDIKKKYSDKINFLEVSDYENKEMLRGYVKKFNLKTAPVVVIMDPMENELERINGLKKEDDYIKLIEKYI